MTEHEGRGRESTEQELLTDAESRLLEIVGALVNLRASIRSKDLARIPADTPGADDIPEMDDDYYAEVRRAVGRGTPTLLLGTSTRSLERSLEQIRAVEHGETSGTLLGLEKRFVFYEWLGLGIPIAFLGGAFCLGYFLSGWLAGVLSLVAAMLLVSLGVLWAWHSAKDWMALAEVRRSMRGRGSAESSEHTRSGHG